MDTRDRSERLWIVGAGVIALLTLVVGWFFLISPQRTEKADVESQTLDAQTQNLTLQTRINQLGLQQKNRTAYSAALGKAREALPDRTDMSLFLRNVQAIAGATGTRVTALNVGDPTAVTPAAAVVPSSTPSAAPSSSAAPGAPGAPAAASGIFAIPIDASVTGSAASLSTFLTRLQAGQPRAVLVTSITRNVGPGGSAVLQLKMNAFVAPTAAPAPTTGGN